MIKDYRIYEFTRKEILFCMLEGMCLNAVISILFFDSLWAMIPGCFLIVFYFKEKRRKLVRQRMQKLRMEFKEFINTLIAILQTGRSMENAFSEAFKDLSRYEEKTVFLKELQKICAGISVGESLEKLLLDFSARSHMEELEYFAEVFSIGKRSGGNLVGIMKNTIRMLQERMDAEEEIYTILAEKRTEFYLMCIIPLVMIVYLRFTAGTMMESLYGNITGVLVMTACLLIYGGCYLYGKRLLEIEH